jgi:hydrogenase maturation protein HypF
MERATIRANGVVQSVGFRPFVYRTAVTLDLRGTVRNRGDAGALVELEGNSDDIDAFLDELRENNPPLARVETVETERESAVETEFSSFEIVDSEDTGGGGGTIPPDTAMCGTCVADMRNPDSRYHDYWATSCLDCGPRFTIVESLPYDRPTTSMAAFPMCENCREEYEAPADRRYHAQAIACPECGPALRYLPSRTVETNDENGEEPPSAGRDVFPDRQVDPPSNGTDAFNGTDAIHEAAEALDDGDIVVIKGIGGAHIACDATNPDAVARLRARTGRSKKPFGLMAADVEMVESFAALTPAERESLTSPRRPILLLDQQGESWLSASVAPGLHTVGVMLPYSGVHHLLFDVLNVPLVMTSANMPGQPMLTHNRDIATSLDNVADGFLLHDRRIVARCDDSVARFVGGERRLVRRSRGFTPTPIPLSSTSDTRILGLGPELDVAAGVLADGDCYLTQYVGDVDTVETFDYLTNAISHLLDITGLNYPDVVAHDAHPEFHTTEHARQLADGNATPVEKLVAVQHHHAHAASVLAEHDRRAAVAITVDGVGYGPDGTVWGGEVLDATRTDYERVGGLAPVPMPGGDRATRYPARMLAGLLAHRDDIERVLATHTTFPNGTEERDLVLQQLDTGVNTPMTTSAGRFIDGVSAFLDVCDERTYEGEPAMKLEALAAGGTSQPVEIPHTTADSRRVLDTPRLMDQLVELTETASHADVAATAQDTIARGLAGLAVDAADERGREVVALSGGVAYNEAIATHIREQVTDADLTFLGNERVPPGDGGIAYGQIAVAAARDAE